MPLSHLDFLKNEGDVQEYGSVKVLFSKGEPLYQGDRIHHFHNLWDPWSKLGDAVRSGKPTAFDDVQEEVDEQRLRDF